MRREPVLWLLALGALVAAFVVSVVALNATVYSANGFVRGYLAALERHDSAAALESLGVTEVTNGSDALLTDTAMGDLSGIELVRDTPGSGGIHTVVFDYRFGAGTDTQRTEFTVEQTGTRFGLFPTWRFVASPLSTLSVTVANADSFTVNGQAASASADTATGFVVFAPGAYELAHDSTYLAAAPETVPVTTTGAILDAAVDPEPTPALIDWATDATVAFLDDCATQTVLMPTGCPFGESISNRIDSEPQWSIVDYPAVEIVRAEQVGAWMTRPADGVAHLNVNVRSLFDGTLSRFDEDVAFEAQFGIAFTGGEPSLRLVG